MGTASGFFCARRSGIDRPHTEFALVGLRSILSVFTGAWRGSNKIGVGAMFLRLLNEDQKKALLVLAYHLVVVGHSVSKGESELLDEIANGLRTRIPVTPQELHQRPDLAIFKDKPQRVAVMLEILTLAHGDNFFPSAESQMVEQLANDLDFSNAEFQAMSTWARKNAVLLAEAEAIFRT